MTMDCPKLIKVSFLFRFLSPFHIFRATSSFPSHSAHWDSERGRDRSVGRGCHNFFLTLELKINNWDRMEERKWAGVGV